MKLRELITLYEGFLTYGGMSIREIEAVAVGLEETMDENMINQGPQFIAYMCEKLLESGIPVITPPGGLGCHLNAMEFVDHIPQSQYPAGSLASALYLVSGCSWYGKRNYIRNKETMMEVNILPIWNCCV